MRFRYIFDSFVLFYVGMVLKARGFGIPCCFSATEVFLVHGDYQPANSALNGAENGRAIVSVTQHGKGLLHWAVENLWFRHNIYTWWVLLCWSTGHATCLLFMCVMVQSEIVVPSQIGCTVCGVHIFIYQEELLMMVG